MEKKKAETLDAITIPQPLVNSTPVAESMKATEDVKLTVETGKPTVLMLKRKLQSTFLDEHSSVPRTKKRTAPVDEPTNQVDKSMTQIDKFTTSVDKPSIPVHKPLLKKPIDFSSVIKPIFSSNFPVPKNPPYKIINIPADNKRGRKESITSIPVLRPYFTPKGPIPKNHEKTPKSRLQTNQLHQNTLDSQSTSSSAECSEWRPQQAGPTTFSSTTPYMIQPFENLNVSVKKPIQLKTHQNTLDSESTSSSAECSEWRPQQAGPTTFSSTTPYMIQPFENLNVSVKKPIQLKTHQNTLDSESTSSSAEFPESRPQQAGPTTSSSTTLYMIQLFEKLKSPYPNDMTFVNHLLNLEVCRNLGTLTLDKNKTTNRQRTSNTATTPPHSIHCLPAQEEYQTVSRTDDDDNDLTICNYLSDKCASDANSTDSHVIPAKKTYKSCNTPKQKSNLSNSFGNKPSRYYDNGDSKKQVIDSQEYSSIIYYPDITITATTSTTPMSITTTEASTNIVSATSPVLTTITETIIASEVPATVEMAAVVTNTSALTIAVADSTTSITDSATTINNTEVPVITNTATINYDKSEITSTVNENTTVDLEI